MTRLLVSLLAWVFLALPVAAENVTVYTPPSAVGTATNNPLYTAIQNGAGAIAANNPLQSSSVDLTQVTFSVTGTGVPTGFPLDTSTGSQNIGIDITSAGSGNTIGFQVSPDASTWYTPNCIRDDLQQVSAVAGANRYWCPLDRYFRINVTAYGSGTISGVVTLKQSPQLLNPIQMVRITPTSSNQSSIAPGSSSSAEGSHVIKSSGGNLYTVYVTAGASAGFLMIFNATSAPGDGAVTPTECIPVAANGTGSIDYGLMPDSYSTGITAVFSTTGCFTKTISATAFFKWRSQ